jgi:D-alanine-D-alanine ligase
MRIAVVRNRSRDGVINRFSTPCPETYGKRTVQMVLDALRAGRHIATCLEGDKTLLVELERFMPPDEGHRPTGLVLNLAYGIQGEARYTHVPAMLEMAGIPYTGATPLGHAISLDKVTTKLILRQAGIPTRPSPFWAPARDRRSACASRWWSSLAANPRVTASIWCAMQSN